MNERLHYHDDLEFPFDLDTNNKDPIEFVRHIEMIIKKETRVQKNKMPKKKLSFKVKKMHLSFKSFLQTFIKIISPV